MRFKLALLLCVVLSVALMGSVQPSHAAAATFFTDRSSFNFSAPGLALENLESGLASSGSLTACDGEPVELGMEQNCFAPATLKPGISYATDDPTLPDGTLIVIGRAVLGTVSKVLITNWNISAFIMNFSEPVNSVGFDLIMLDISGAPGKCVVDVYDAGGLKGSAQQDCDAKGSHFIGVQSDTLITSIVVNGAGTPTQTGPFKGADNIAFGFVDFTSTKANPAILNLSPVATYLNMSARLTKGEDPLAGQTLHFLINDVEVCSAVTDAGGNASCGTPLDLVSIALSPTMTYKALFKGDSSVEPALSPSAGSAGLIGGLPNPPQPPPPPI